MGTVESTTHRYPSSLRSTRSRRSEVRGWAVALVAVSILLVATGTAAVVSLLLEPRYGARSEVLFDLGDITSEPQADRLLATQLAVLGSRAVLGPVAEMHGIPPRDLARRVEAELRDDSQIIELTVSAASPEEAVAVAGDVIDQYLSLSQAGISAQAADQIERLTAAVNDLATQRAALAADLAEAGDDAATVAELEVALEAVIRRMRAWQGELITLELAAEDPVRADVLAPPYPLDDPLRPRPLQAAAGGAAVGLVLAAGAVLGLRRIGGRRM